MNKFTNQSTIEIIEILAKDFLKLDSQESLVFEVLNPDLCTTIYAGNTLTINSTEYIARGYKSWLDLGQILKSRMLTPEINSEYTVLLRFEKLDDDESFHKSIDDKEEKYGEKSIFSHIHKNEEPAFIHYYLQALKNVNITKRTRILNLGVNSGDEFEAIINSTAEIENLEFIGIDYCSSAIQKAKEKFSAHKNISFHTHDINDLVSLNLGEFDLIISIGTLQSSNLEFNALLMSIVQNQLKRDGAMILGFPNCRWVDGEMVYGARVKNYPFSEMGLLYKDVIFCKKYLQQKKFRVTITGKEYIFLTATSIRKD
ncbi:methyltransferase domain-containing protein [Sulfurimonas sp.]|jgi:cyclopropane fatty-acyl-phospholipid synthase-like methyltransferase|uniref:class I SAM-dependent methyltransferase n=1 Tax=Sulfurimonas sp. TaxID=2022749 RepID=UPI0025D30766|nr:methyltransferase domain-containing protein [Sulfurimonas sp.]MBT5934280.1 methyltransferase domain-containing protein [Sulfurimonas sp.]